MAKELVEEVQKISGVEKKAEGELMERAPPNKEHFDALIAADETLPLPSVPAEQVPLLEEVRQIEGHVDLMRRKSPEEVMAQTQEVIAQIHDIKGKLGTPDLQLSSAVQTVMQNKLSHIDDKLRVAVEQVGGEYRSFDEVREEEKGGLRTPIERFMGVLEIGEEQLQNVFHQVDVLGAGTKSMEPGALLLLQIKVAFVQQELEFFTAVLNKALESTKTLMNVQV